MENNDFIMATNVIASRPPKRRLTGTPYARANTRFLIGLRTGNLLATKLEEQEIIEQGWSVPIFSPDLKIWRTPLGQAMLVSGSIGVNPQFIEPRNNFPRFNVVVKENMNDAEVLDLINMRGKELISELKNNAPMESVCLAKNETEGQSFS